jgi:hypothetical protein
LEVVFVTLRWYVKFSFIVGFWGSPYHQKFLGVAMKIGRSVTIALGVLFLLCLSLGSTALAATPNLKGTYVGSGKFVYDDGKYYFYTVTVQITNQNGRLFVGTSTVTVGTTIYNYGVTGCISGSKINLTTFDPASRELQAYYDVTLSTDYSKITGTFRGIVAPSVGYVTLKKQ